MRNVSVVIPAYGDRGLLDALLLRLHNYCDESLLEIIVIDNGNHWNDIDFGTERWVHLPQNIGFGPAVNCGAGMIRGDFIGILSTDVEFSEDILKASRSILENGDAAIVGGKIWDTDTGWNKFGDKIYPYVEGWFLMMWTNDWINLGGISPEFYPHDYDDIDLSTKALAYQDFFAFDPNSYGVFLKEVNAPTLKHLGGRTLGYNPERLAVTRFHRDIFKRKWANE